jgi:hypothetical protein
VSAYSDLMALARLCLAQARRARTPAAAQALQKLAKEYEDRAVALQEEGASLPSDPQAPSHVVQQQQQPQVVPVPSPSAVPEEGGVGSAEEQEE